MQRLIMVVGAVLMTLGVMTASPPAAHAANCRFVLGFATLHSMIPTISGDCVTNETYAANGDGLQQTANGLMVWRKSDNFTAFTNGSTTWVNGPLGLQKRPNNERFAWEVNDAKVTQTQVIMFMPPTSVSAQISGSCFAPSIASTRGDAWRCMSGNLIYDPCFTKPGSSNAVVCVQDPTDSSTIVQMNLTQPLPDHGPILGELHPWFLQLADGSVCNFLTGATGAVNGERINYGCSSGWDLIGTPTQDTVWTASAVLLAPNSLNVNETATAEIAKAFK